MYLREVGRAWKVEFFKCLIGRISRNSPDSNFYVTSDTVFVPPMGRLHGDAKLQPQRSNKVVLQPSGRISSRWYGKCWDWQKRDCLKMKVIFGCVKKNWTWSFYSWAKLRNSVVIEDSHVRTLSSSREQHKRFVSNLIFKVLPSLERDISFALLQ